MNASTGTYPYQVDFENMINYGKRDLDGRAKFEEYTPDTASAAAMAKTHANINANAGLAVGSALFDNGNIVEVVVNSHLGPLAQKRFLLPRTRVLFNFIPNIDEFLLRKAAEAAVSTYEFYIKGIKLRVRTVKLSQQAPTLIYRNLLRSRALYPTPAPMITSSVIENGFIVGRKIMFSVEKYRNY